MSDVDRTRELLARIVKAYQDFEIARLRIRSDVAIREAAEGMLHESVEQARNYLSLPKPR